MATVILDDLIIHIDRRQIREAHSNLGGRAEWSEIANEWTFHFVNHEFKKWFGKNKIGEHKGGYLYKVIWVL